MGKVAWKGGALIAPVPPAMISCMGSDGKPNIITVAWTGILSTHPPKTYISVRPTRHSYELIKQSGEFVINLTSTFTPARTRTATRLLISTRDMSFTPTIITTIFRNILTTTVVGAKCLATLQAVEHCPASTTTIPLLTLR